MMWVCVQFKFRPFESCSIPAEEKRLKSNTRSLSGMKYSGCRALPIEWHPNVNQTWYPLARFHSPSGLGWKPSCPSTSWLPQQQSTWSVQSSPGTRPSICSPHRPVLLSRTIYHSNARNCYYNTHHRDIPEFRQGLCDTSYSVGAYFFDDV